MKQGVVLIAINNDIIDYVSLAKIACRRIHHFLNLPVTLVTNQHIHSHTFDSVIISDQVTRQQFRYFEDYGQSSTWYNISRSDVYELSPYEQTIVMDVDYIVNSNQLTNLLNIPLPYAVFNRAYEILERDDFNSLNFFGMYNFPITWATVFVFTKGAEAKMFFDCVAMIRENYNHYCNLHRMSRNLYRNDIAFAIAANILNANHGVPLMVPWALPSVRPDCVITPIGKSSFRIAGPKQGTWHSVLCKDMDFHAMGKKQLVAISEYL